MERARELLREVVVRPLRAFVNGVLQYTPFQQLINPRQTAGPNHAVDSALPSIPQSTGGGSLHVMVDMTVAGPDTLKPGLAAVPDASQTGLAATLQPGFAAIPDTFETGLAAVPDAQQTGLLTAPSQDSGQTENTRQCTAHKQTKVLSALLTFLTLCVYLAIQ
ncbi:hypothetical protein BGZ99_004214, partial [Dissophora globulifera]